MRGREGGWVASSGADGGARRAASTGGTLRYRTPYHRHTHTISGPGSDSVACAAHPRRRQRSWYVMLSCLSPDVKRGPPSARPASLPGTATMRNGATARPALAVGQGWTACIRLHFSLLRRRPKTMAVALSQPRRRRHSMPWCCDTADAAGPVLCPRLTPTLATTTATATATSNTGTSSPPPKLRGPWGRRRLLWAVATDSPQVASQQGQTATVRNLPAVAGPSSSSSSPQKQAGSQANSAQAMANWLPSDGGLCALRARPPVQASP